ncbi:MAG TPA: hypothetical protein VGO67_12185 [Verrucomicrobiae bacterium]|jgi:hypothetical protein
MTDSFSRGMGYLMPKMPAWFNPASRMNSLQHWLNIAVTNARFASLHGLPVALSPFDDAHSTSQTARSSRASGLPSVAPRRDVAPAPIR